AGQEDHGHHGIDGVGREQVKHDRPQRGGDHHMHQEGHGGTEPAGVGRSPRGHDQRGKHGLVGQFASEDDRENRADDRKVHVGGPCLPAGPCPSAASCQSAASCPSAASCQSAASCPPAASC